MAINNSHPIRFTPRGLTDAFDSTDKFPGACQQLVNLIFDQSNPELMVARPGVSRIVAFSTRGFLNPGFISIQAGIGSRIFGMVATSRNANHDEPFCYDMSTGLFVAIGGVTMGNTPTSPASSGTEWTPPTLSMVGTMVIITHPGFDGTGVNFYGVIDLTNPVAPVWRSENTATNPLTAVPTACVNFNNRAYFAVNNQLQYTDVLTNPLTRTNATQALTLGDTSPLNALAGLPVQTTSSGVVSAVTAFKKTQVWQITGDEVTQDLKENYLSLTIGTNAPRSVAQSTYGIYFSSTGGPYFIDPLGTLRPLTYGTDTLDPDVVAPFENATLPTRWAAAYNSTIYRVCGPTSLRGVAQTNDYWFDEHKRRWHGPHSFQYDCASAIAGDFILSSVNHPGLLILSPPQTINNTTFNDLDDALTCVLLTSTMPKVGDMLMKQVTESQIELALSGPAGGSYQITAQDDQGTALGACSIGIPAGVLWGTNNWGDGSRWTSGNASIPAVPHTYPVPWPAPLVFEKMQLQVNIVASGAVGIGTFYARYQKTGYMTLGR